MGRETEKGSWIDMATCIANKNLPRNRMHGNAIGFHYVQFRAIGDEVGGDNLFGGCIDYGIVLHRLVCGIGELITYYI